MYASRWSHEVVTITFSVPPFSYNVATKQNMAIDWILEMANVLTENNGAWHTTLATSIKLVGALDLGIELGSFFDIPPIVDTPMGLGMVSINTNDCGSHTQH